MNSNCNTTFISVCPTDPQGVSFFQFIYSKGERDREKNRDAAPPKGSQRAPTPPPAQDRGHACASTLKESSRHANDLPTRDGRAECFPRCHCQALNGSFSGRYYTFVSHTHNAFVLKRDQYFDSGSTHSGPPGQPRNSAKVTGSCRHARLPRGLWEPTGSAVWTRLPQRHPTSRAPRRLGQPFIHFRLGFQHTEAFAFVRDVGRKLFPLALSVREAASDIFFTL